MLVRSVVQHQVHDDADIERMRRFDQGLQVFQVAVHVCDSVIIGDVITIVAQRRRIDRHQPDAVDAQVVDVLKLLLQPPQIAKPIPVAVLVGAHRHLVKNGILIPEIILFH